VTIRAFRCCSPHHGGPSHRVKPSYTLGWPTPLAAGPAPVSESRRTTRWTADTLLYTMLSGWWVEAAALVAAFVIATCNGSSRCFGSCASAPVPGEHPRHAKSCCHTDKPALQRRRHARGAVAVLASGSTRRSPRSPAPRRDAAGSRCRFDCSRRASAGAATIRRRGVARPYPNGRLAFGRSPSHFGRASVPYSRQHAHCHGSRSRLCWRYLRHRWGAILAPFLIGSGRSPSEVAPATLASTFLTSIAGVPRKGIEPSQACSKRSEEAPSELEGKAARKRHVTPS
jgi:hypothetical protein